MTISLKRARLIGKKALAMSCGYQGKCKRGGTVSSFRARSSSSCSSLQTKKEVVNTSIVTCNIEDFFKICEEMPSKYNGRTMKTITTQSGKRRYLISNIMFKNKKIQFVAVDGSSVDSNNPTVVMDNFNKGILKPISFSIDAILTDNDKACIDAYSGSIFYCMFLDEVLGHVGIINDDMVFLSLVNVNISNAFWNGFYMTYGNGNCETNPLTSLKIVGHEASHGVIESLGGLDYHGESGAINESISDIFGVCLERYYKMKTQPVNGFWQIGEDITEGGIRSMSNPNQHEQPACYKGKFWVDPKDYIDNGGVHTNSGVGNYIFYMLVAGGGGESEFGNRFNVKYKFDIFKLTRIIFMSLRGENGYLRLCNRCTYKDFTNILSKNGKKFIEENKLDIKLLSSFDEAFLAAGLSTEETLLIEEYFSGPGEDDNIVVERFMFKAPNRKNMQEVRFTVPLPDNVTTSKGCIHERDILTIPPDEYVEIDMKKTIESRRSLAIDLYNPYNPVYIQFFDINKLAWKDFLIPPHPYHKKETRRTVIHELPDSVSVNQDFTVLISAGLGKSFIILYKVSLLSE